MALWDVLHSIANYVGLYRNTEELDGQEYDDQIVPGEMEEQMVEEPVYTSQYGTGDSYVRAGAKLRPASVRRPSVDAQSPIQNLFGRGQAQRQQTPYNQPDNVIHFPDRESREHDASASAQANTQSSNIIICVRRKDDSSQIISHLLAGTNVILNFEEVDDALTQRVLDMVSGAAFALRGTVERISLRNYLVVPSGVEIVRGETAQEVQAQQPRDRRFGAYNVR